MAAVDVSAPVSEALSARQPVVALESTIISHGLPRPTNLAAARQFEAALRAAEITPATIAVIRGRIKVGLDEAELELIATDRVEKVSVRDLPILIAQGGNGATTVAATSYIAERAGIRVFATGGLGGVHRKAAQSFDESADLTTLSATPITVVSAGVKSILDIPATLERMETLGISVLGWRTTRFPSFWLTDSGVQLDWSVPDAEAVAAVMAANDELGRRQAVVVANPLPESEQLDPALHDQALAQALDSAKNLRGKDVSPFLLAAMVEATQGRSLEVNLQIAHNNIDVAGQIARAWSQRGSHAARR